MVKNKERRTRIYSRKFCKKVGIAKTTYSSYEQGHRNPTVQTAKNGKNIKCFMDSFLKSKYSIRIILKGDVKHARKNIGFLKKVTLSRFQESQKVSLFTLIQKPSCYGHLKVEVIKDAYQCWAHLH